MRTKNGFTLIELMVVIAIIAILTALGFYGLRQAQAIARDSGRVNVASQIRAQLEQYYADNQFYPLATTGFATMATALNLNATNTKDPGCGSGSIGYVSTGATWSPAAVAGGCGFVTQPTYTYARPTANTYTLTLVKEGGGTVTYSQPQ